MTMRSKTAVSPSRSQPSKFFHLHSALLSHQPQPPRKRARWFRGDDLPRGPSPPRPDGGCFPPEPDGNYPRSWLERLHCGGTTVLRLAFVVVPRVTTSASCRTQVIQAAHHPPRRVKIHLVQYLVPEGDAMQAIDEGAEGPGGAGGPGSLEDAKDIEGPATRASDRERDAVVQRVQEAFAEGRLDDTEFDERMRAALTARTHADLDAALADLPAATAGTGPARA